MNITQNGNVLKFIAFFLVGVILLCLFGFTVDGWQLNKEDIANDTSTLDKEETPESAEDASKDQEIYIPEYVNVFTGLETSTELSNKRHLAFILDASAPLYGVSYSDILIEFPVENGVSRLASITNDYLKIGKIGSLTKTKDYISTVVTAFGSVIVANGKDRPISENNSNASSDIIDLETMTESKYSEFNMYNYSNGALISQGASSLLIEDTYISFPSLPYAFPEFGKERVKGESVFKTVTIPYSTKNTISLQYNSEAHSYFYFRNNDMQTDLLNGKDIQFENCLILFADSVTYEDSNGLRMVLQTNEYGKGYFFTEGTAKEISWEYSNIGSLTFYDEEGEKLTINRGRTYIAFVKSSEKNNIILS